MSKKNKRHKLNNYWSPYENGYISPKPQKSEIEVQKKPEPVGIQLDMTNPNTLVTLAMLGRMYRGG